mgnify:CR=1 FL=1
MAVSRIKTWISAEVLYAVDLNAEIDNILNNGLSVVSPWTANMDAGGFRLITLAAGTVSNPSLQPTGDPNTGPYFSAADTYDIAAGGVRVHSFATATAGVNYLVSTPAATGVAPSLSAAGSNTNIGLRIVPKGSGTIDVPLAGYLFGLTLSNNGVDAINDIDIAVGETTSNDTNAVDRRVMGLRTAITKRLDAAWTVGTNQGGLDTGAIANTTYHMWLIMRPDTEVVDVLFSTSATAPTMPTNYTLRRRIGSIVRAAGTIRAFIQDGDWFTYSVPIGDRDSALGGTTAVTLTLSVPTGINVRALFAVKSSYNASYPVYMWFSDLAQTDTAPSASVFNHAVGGSGATNAQSGSLLMIRTNTSAQIRARTDTDIAVTISMQGWIDTRGRMA